MPPPYTPPSFSLGAFHCPHCQSYSNQEWTDDLPDRYALLIADCLYCGGYSLWHYEQMIYPDSAAEAPNADLSDEIQADYMEAGIIVRKSPRGAAALLRLCVQKLCVQLGEKGEKIDDDIASLVQIGLPPKIQKALDIVRVIGNEAVHPGQLDLKDDVATAMKLFELINLIAQDRITTPNQIDAVYESLPATSLEHIKKRDAPRETSEL